ncbi:diaminopimelate decarboxylase [Actinomycetospora sp. NBRC 106378]|uniref:diaminopimelate decarboxylase n=1 Tax=Actinomycetospora sp. NBRC 106378 TaxID=3032208 RepID=UPI0024A2398B|nr:diaminopimelate decarboxylase [Actinomycetospora sp. NBRC 106378]GLZ51905.1 diaminopimelate decarboxylase [Actinomycetospora sp. NBRC 106378]
MPLSPAFSARLLPLLDDLVRTYGTPFHLYDAAGIVASHREVTEAFAGAGHRQYFAVKALPNPAVLALLRDAGSGLDCASGTELHLAERLGVRGDDLVFTSNNTALPEYHQALAAGAAITFDDRPFAERLDTLPHTVSFRVAPHGAAGSHLMGDAAGSKFGVPVDDLPAAYRSVRARGVTSFGLHGMSCANESSAERAAQAADDVLAVGAGLRDHGIDLDVVNVGGGLGIPYRPGEEPLDVRRWAGAVIASRDRWFPDRAPQLRTELGRIVTGPHGVLVTRVINRSRKHREVVGLDASMSALMRPALYGAYHHITLPSTDDRPLRAVDVVGGLCENMDKFAVNRHLPDPRPGDIALVHDTGAHGHAMGFTYNGRLRPAELLLTADGDVVEIRRAETFDDYVSTVRWSPASVLPAGVR